MRPKTQLSRDVRRDREAKQPTWLRESREFLQRLQRTDPLAAFTMKCRKGVSHRVSTKIPQHRPTAVL